MSYFAGADWPDYNRETKALKRTRQAHRSRYYWRNIRWRAMVNADTALLGRVPDYALRAAEAKAADDAILSELHPCRCGSSELEPVCDQQWPRTFAIECDECGEIEGDGPDLKSAVANWNEWADAPDLNEID